VPSPWHTFVNGWCACGVPRERLRGIDASWVGRTTCPPDRANDGIVHAGSLNLREAQYIEWLNKQERHKINEVMGWNDCN